MKEICKLVAEKGFKTKTATTSVTFKYYTEGGKNLLINDTCNYLLLAEIQKWVREEFQIFIQIFYHKSNKYEVMIVNSSDNIVSHELFGDMFITYEDALKAGIKEILENYAKQ